jgi:hypothetical protein
MLMFYPCGCLDKLYFRLIFSDLDSFNPVNKMTLAHLKCCGQNLKLSTGKVIHSILGSILDKLYRVYTW